MPLALFERLATALAIGFIIGVERGWRDRRVAEGGRAAGVRTYALTGLLGGVAALLSQVFGGWALAALGLPLAAAFILFKQREQAADQDVSATAVVAGLLVFALGALAVVGDSRLAAAAAVAAAGLLAGKTMLHAWLERLTWPELRAALVLLAMSFVVLPLLPSRPLGPFGVVNPAELWLLTIAMATVSFVAYAAIRILGPARGALVGSAVGALVSSTAVTYSLARLQRRAPNTAVYAGAALTAGGVMAARLAIIVLIVAPSLLRVLGPALAAFAATSALLGLILAAAKRAPGTPEPPPGLKNPFDLDVILKFALVLGAIMAAARAASALYGPAGLLPVAALGGLADADAVTLAAARLARDGAALDLAAKAVLLAAGVDSASKAVLALAIGGKRFGGLFALGTLIAAGLAWIAWRLT